MLNIRDGKELKEKFEAMMARIKTAMPKANLLGVNLIQMVNGIECIVGITTDPQFGSGGHVWAWRSVCGSA